MILVIMLILVMVCCLNSCSSGERIIIDYNDDCIAVSSETESEFAVVITVVYSEGKTIDILHQVNLEEGKSKIIKLEELNKDLFNENAKIVSATLIIQEDSNENAVKVLVSFCLGMLIGTGITLVSIFKKTPDANGSPK